jgi:NitT/TauT family transport system substrate-binding protein
METNEDWRMRHRRTDMRKLVMSVLIVFLLIPGEGLGQVTKLNVGYVGINSDNVIAFIAKESGIFAKNGLDVQLIYFGGGTTATMALVAGETPITQTAGPGVVNAVLGGADAVMIAGGVTTLDYWLLSRPEVKTAEQLRGGAVAISRFGSASDFIVRYALQSIGLVPIKEVAILQVGALPERLAAMETKRCRPPCWRRRRCTWRKSAVSIFWPTAALGLAYQATGVGTTKKFIREHADIVRRYVKARWKRCTVSRPTAN